MKLDIGGDGLSLPLTGSVTFGIPTAITTISNDTITVSGSHFITKGANFVLSDNGDVIAVSGVVGRRIRVLALTISCSKNTQFLFKSGLVTVKIGPMFISQGIPLDVNRMPSGYFMETNVGEAFVINSSINAGLVAGSLTYVEV